MSEEDYLPKNNMSFAGKFKPIPSHLFDKYKKGRDRILILTDILLQEKRIIGDVAELKELIAFVKQVRPKLFATIKEILLLFM